MIKFTDVSFGFPQKDLYNEICFEIEQGDHAALIGSNGTGKSTLIDMIIHTDDYLYDGKIEKDENVRIGYIPQFVKHESEDLSAFDFLAKPFGMEVVVAKIQAVLRRSYAFVSEKALCCVGNVTLDLTEAVLHYKEKELKLSGNEFGILKILMKNPKGPVSREELMRSLWESEHFIDDNTLTVNVTRLRKKLEEIGLCEFIKTRKGIGYQIREEQGR